MNLRIGLFVFFIAGVISGTAVAGVNLKNGNFYISYTDLVAGSLTQIDIARTYNSKSTRLGWFGYGWGSDYETHLETTASGAIIIRENGSGAITDFEPVKKLNKYGTNLQKSIKKLVKEFIKANPDKDTNEDELTKKFETDKEYRQSYWRQVIKNGSVNPIIIAKDTKFVSGQRGLQYVTRTDTGYVRHYNDGKEEYFDNYGQITEIRFNNGNWIKLSYYPQDNQTFFTRSKIRQIKNNHGDIIFFFFGDRNTIERIVSNRQETTNFHYDKKRNLIFSKDTSGNSYVYRYDKNHNLLEVLYSDGLKMLITYEPETQFVKSVKTRDGSITKYEYESEKNDPDNHYWTLVTKKNYIGTLKTNRYEYIIEVLSDGKRYTKKIITEIAGLRTETVYNKHGNPLDIKRGNLQTKFKYNDKGLLELKETDTEITKLEYHPVFNKITRVETKQKFLTDSVTWSKFKYDDHGNLSFGASSNGDAVTLKYDKKGQIEIMEANNEVLTFVYSEIGKPTEIAIKDVGKINVSYDKDGEIQNINSEQGHNMSLKVTQAFQRLLNIVKPAGVSLNF